jgi:hypothetical protein
VLCSFAAQNPNGIASEGSHYPWKAYLDPESGSVFWYNEETHQSQWEMPTELGAEHSALYNAQLALGMTGAGAGQPGGSGDSSVVHSARSRDTAGTGGNRVRDSLDLSGAQGTEVGRGGGIAMTGRAGIGKRSRLRSGSYEEEHVVAVHDHETDLGI